MSRNSIVLTGIAFTCIFFVIGWISYDWILSFVTVRGGQHITTISLEEAFTHRLMLSLSLSSSGASLGFGTLLSGRFSSVYNYRRSLLILLLVAVIAVSAWFVVLANKLSALGDNFASVDVPILPKTSLLLSEIPLYEIGLFGSGCVIVTAIILTILASNQER